MLSKETEMQVVIAHQSSVQKARLAKRLQSVMGIDVVRMSGQLRETYVFVAHHQPDCILISGHLTRRPEFELLDALLRIHGIGCVVLKDPEDISHPPISALAAEHVIRIPGTASDEVLQDALERAPGTLRGGPVAGSPAPPSRSFDPKRIILIGSSTGGVDALLRIISEFPADCPPTLIVQHTGGCFAPSLIRLLDGATAARVIPARDGMGLSPGEIYLPPGDEAHLKLRAGPNRQIVLKPSEPVSGHRPSVDALFRSALNHARHVTAALLTGMGRDGADGITQLREAGAKTIGQDAASSVVYGMPRVAKEMGGIETELPLSKIGPTILRMSQAKAAP